MEVPSFKHMLHVSWIIILNIGALIFADLVYNGFLSFFVVVQLQSSMHLFFLIVVV